MTSGGAGDGRCGVWRSEAAERPVPPAAVFEEMTILARVLAHLPHMQPFALVAPDGRVLAANRPLFDLLGCDESALVGKPWRTFMPSWPSRDALPADAALFCDWLDPAGQGSRRRAHLLVDPVGTPGDPVAYALFVSGVEDEPGARLRPARRLTLT